MPFDDWRSQYLDDTSNRVFNTLQRMVGKCEFRGMTKQQFTHIDDVINELYDACYDASPLTLDEKDKPDVR